VLIYFLHSRLSNHAPLSKPIALGASDSLKIVLTAIEGKAPKRPHQALLLVKDVDTGLEISYPFSVKEGGKGKVDLVRETPLSLYLPTTDIDVCRP
jgi:oligosaccharyltransferase complex subunit delta (ribophorin II)